MQQTGSSSMWRGHLRHFWSDRQPPAVRFTNTTTPLTTLPYFQNYQHNKHNQHGYGTTNECCSSVMGATCSEIPHHCCSNGCSWQLHKAKRMKTQFDLVRFPASLALALLKASGLGNLTKLDCTRWVKCLHIFHELVLLYKEINNLHVASLSGSFK